MIDLAKLLEEQKHHNLPTPEHAPTRATKTSRVENRVMLLLEERGIPLTRQVRYGRWVFDAAINDTKILVEVDGKYWHGTQTVQERDKRKNTWCKEHGYTLFRVPEKEFKQDPMSFINAIFKQWNQLRGIVRQSKKEQ